MFKGLFNRMMYGRSDRPDLTKEDMAQNPFQLFFEILGVKIWELIKLNLLAVVFLIPLIAWTSINLKPMAEANFIGDMYQQYKMVYLMGLIPCLCIAGLGFVGITYVIRNYSQDRHSWLMSDFIANLKSNAKQTLAYMALLGVILYAGDRILFIYSGMVAVDGNFLISIMRGVFIVLFGFFLLASMYVFPMMVTYELKLKHIIRNSLIFALSRLHFTLLFWIIILLPGAIMLFISIYWPYAMIGVYAYYGLFGISFAIYMINSYTNHVFKKFMSINDDDDDDDDGKTILIDEDEQVFFDSTKEVE